MDNQLVERHHFFMGFAIEEAKKALSLDEVPVGAIIVHENTIIGAGFNQRENLQNPTAHAEILAITEASKKLGTWRLNNSTLYVTMEPCAMCAGASVLARIHTVVFAMRDSNGGACGTVFNVVNDPRINHKLQVITGVRTDEAKEIIQKFFAEKRKMR